MLGILIFVAGFVVGCLIGWLFVSYHAGIIIRQHKETISDLKTLYDHTALNTLDCNKDAETEMELDGAIRMAAAVLYVRGDERWTS